MFAVITDRRSVPSCRNTLAVGTSIHFALREEIRKFCLAYYNGGL